MSSDKDRLIELLQGAKDKYINLLDFEKSLIAKHLLENGVIVPPCKVGDDIYWIDSDTNEIKCQKNGIKAVCYFGDDNFKIISKDENTPEDIGTRWCMFTKEEAEEKLKELTNESQNK